MVIVDGIAYLEETQDDIFTYLGHPSPRQLAYLRSRYGLPFIVLKDGDSKKGERVYPIRDVNQWILKERAYLYGIDAPIDFVTTKQAPMIGKDSFWSLAHQRIRGKGLPFYRIGYKVVYVKTDVLH